MRVRLVGNRRDYRVPGMGRDVAVDFCPRTGYGVRLSGVIEEHFDDGKRPIA
jgi:hypothetical protein